MLKQTQGHATKCRSVRSDSHPRSHTGGRWLRQGIPASRCPLEIGVDKRCGLALVAGEQMAVAIESDRDRRVFHVGRQGLHVDTGGYEHTGSGMAGIVQSDRGQVGSSPAISACLETVVVPDADVGRTIPIMSGGPPSTGFCAPVAPPMCKDGGLQRIQAD